MDNQQKYGKGLSLEELRKMPLGPRSNVRIPDQMHIPVFSLELLNELHRERLNGTNDKAWFPLILEDAYGPVEPLSPVLLEVRDNRCQHEDRMNPGDIALVNPNVSVENGDIACLRWKGTWMTARVVFHPDGRAEIRFPNPAYESIWVEPTEKEQLHIAGRVVWSTTMRPVGKGEGNHSPKEIP